MSRRISTFLVCLWFVSACSGQEVWYLTPRSFHASPIPSEPTAEIRIARGGVEHAEPVVALDGQPVDGALFLTPFPSEVAGHVFVRGVKLNT